MGRGGGIKGHFTLFSVTTQKIICKFAMISTSLCIKILQNLKKYKFMDFVFFSSLVVFFKIKFLFFFWMGQAGESQFSTIWKNYTAKYFCNFYYFLYIFLSFLILTSLVKGGPGWVEKSFPHSRKSFKMVPSSCLG